MRIVIDSIIRRMISDFFCKEFLIFSDFVCIIRSSLFNRVILRILFICSLFIIFLMIMIFKIFRSTSSTIKIVNSRACFVVLRLIDLSATIDLIIDSQSLRVAFRFESWVVSLQLFNRRLHALKYAVQRRIVDDERVRCCCSNLIKQSDRITQQRERFRIFDDAHSMKILLYLRLQFSLRVLTSQREVLMMMMMMFISV